jgi:hypothetical protein
VYVLAALTGESSANGGRRRFLRHHLRRVERFANAMARADKAISPEQSEVRAELLLGALDGLAFRWALDDEFDFAGFARLASEKLI